MSKNKFEFAFINKWMKQTKAKIRLVRPDITDEKLDKYLKEIVDEHFKDHTCIIDNNYRNKQAQISLLNLTQYLHDSKPIIAGNGVLYKNQSQAPNPAAGMLIESKANRDRLKAERRQYDERSHEFLMKDIGQGNEKVIANSYYGASGNKVAVFYNLHNASSVTGTGQALISTSETSFEAFLANNAKFYDMDECMLFIDRVLHKTEYTTEVDVVDNVYEKTLNKILDSFIYSNKIDVDMIKTILHNLTDEELTKLYYKNNFVAFMKEMKPARKILHKLVNETISFRDPNKVPEEIEDDLKELWKYCSEWVTHLFPIRERITRAKYNKRRVGIYRDTDSTMLTIDKAMNLLVSEFAEDEVAAETEDDFDFILCNMICYLLSRWSRAFLDRYAKDVNIPKDYWKLLSMKNEFYYPKIVLTSKKKRYVTIMKLQEGKEVNPPKIEVHGLDFAKAETSDKTKAFFDKIIADEIMQTDNINVSKIFRLIKDFEKTIEKSILVDRSTEYLTLKSVKEPEAYDDPFSEQGIKAVHAWNTIYPDLAISLPDKIYLVKIVCDKRKVFDSLYNKLPKEIAERILNGIFESTNPKISKNGFGVLAIPQNVDKLPEWVVDVVNIRAMIDDNVGKFNPILMSLGDVPLNTRANEPHMSNIIDL